MLRELTLGEEKDDIESELDDVSLELMDECPQEGNCSNPDQYKSQTCLEFMRSLNQSRSEVGDEKTIVEPIIKKWGILKIFKLMASTADRWTNTARRRSDRKVKINSKNGFWIKS